MKTTGLEIANGCLSASALCLINLSFMMSNDCLKASVETSDRHALSHHSVGTAEEANNNKDTFSKWSTNGIETILKSQNTNCIYLIGNSPL